MSHTPGPWTITVHPQTSGQFIVGSDPVQSVICEIRRYPEREESQANARLMAAAPALLAALKEAVANSDRVEAEGSKRTPAAQRLYDQAIAAIARVEGRS